ncbi:hypothetical protein Mal52_33940 [Symmachiella dynata]|uniref:Segregation and condensation protein B n=2 Tax=Symmachiella dynata TaxID=2527995 RepID=A0A517ZR53_9PLAN|nr:hypothetical protein Mal52_33940 [Symmachiella dynata]
MGPCDANGVAPTVSEMDNPPADEFSDELDISAEEIDAQYLRAVEAMDDADWGIEVPEAVPEATVEGDGEAETSPGEETIAAGASASEAESSSADDDDEQEDQSPRFTPPQILEAALFVGGKPLTSKKLAGLLGDSFNSSAVQSLADEMNQTYAAENRPYEIRLGEGGYTLALRESFSRVRNRVFGVGPREVKLSQDALGILALVAYQQPITREDAEATGRKNAGGLLSQLVRRQLIEIHRDEENPKEVTYHTTPRFLSVFGIGSLDELPMADVLDKK